MIWWDCLVLSWARRGRIYRPAHPIFPAELGSTWCHSWKLENKEKGHCSCCAGLAGCWVLLHLGNFPKGLHSSDILAESYPELKALYSITSPGSGSQPPAPETTMCLSASCLSLFVWPRGWQGLPWNTRCRARCWAGPSTTAEKAIKNSISVNWQI